MLKNSKIIAGLVSFALILVLSVAVLVVTDILFSNPIQSLFLLLCIGVAGVAVLARGVSRPSSRTPYGERAPQSLISVLPNVAAHLSSGPAKRAHPTKVRLRVERWENEKRAAVEEPLKKALQRARAHTCPMCGSRAANICACRYRPRHH